MEDQGVSQSRKIGITIIFCLTLVVMAFETLRFAESIAGTASSNNSIWINMEGAIAVIVSCLPTYSVLLSWHTQPQTRTLKQTNSSNAYLMRKPKSDNSFTNVKSIKTEDTLRE